MKNKFIQEKECNFIMVQKKNLIQFMLVSLAVTGLGSTACAAVPDSGISVDLNCWRPSVDGSSKMRMPNSSSVNLKKDLGFDSKSVLGLTVNYKQGPLNTWYVGAEGAEFKHTKSLNKDFSFKGTEYHTGDKADSDLKVSHYQIGLRSKWSANSNFYTNYQINHVYTRTSITDNDSGQSQNRNRNFTALGLGIGWETQRPERVNFFAEINPISLFGCGRYGENKIGVKMSVTKNIGLTL